MTEMDQASAQNIIRSAIRVTALLNQLVGDLEKTLPKSGFDAERQRIGSILGEVSGLIEAAVEPCPSLNVDSDEAWRRAGELDAPFWLGTPSGWTKVVQRVPSRPSPENDLIALIDLIDFELAAKSGEKSLRTRLSELLNMGETPHEVAHVIRDAVQRLEKIETLLRERSVTAEDTSKPEPV